MRIAALIIGIIVATVTFLALCQAMLVPRRSTSVLVQGINRGVAVVSTWPLRFMKRYETQDRWLSGAAPISVLLQLVVYVVILILALGLVVYGTTTLSLNDSLYQSGSTLTTLGIVEPVDEASTITTFVAAFLGLVVIAIFIGYLMAIYGAYVDREAGMARAAMLAGEPAWGPIMLARGRILGLPDSEVPDSDMWLEWLCSTRMSQQVNPVLMEFRSTSAGRHWVTTLLAVLDAGALRISLGDGTPDPHTVQLLTEGSLTLATLTAPVRVDPHEVATHNWDLERMIVAAVRNPPPESPPECGLTSDDFEQAMDILRDAGVPVPDDVAGAFRRFAAVRAVYYSDAAAIAKRLHAVPAPWSGERTPSLPVRYPEIPTEN
ncbi:MAG: hypothetical protein U0R64_03675 [Candidatus Nanopelagicales bacterium]